MRKLAFTLAGIVLLSASPSFAWMPGDSQYDPGCNVHVGGNCGRQLDSWNHTWRRLGLPQEPGRGAYGTYLPGGGFVTNGDGGFVGGGAYGGVAGVPGYGYGGFGRRFGRTKRTVVVTWHRHYETRVQSAAPVPSVAPEAVQAAAGPAVVGRTANVGYVPPGFKIVHE